jgi:hypothetical protein
MLKHGNEPSPEALLFPLSELDFCPKRADKQQKWVSFRIKTGYI